MFKTVLLIAVLGMLLLSVAIIILVSLNWSEKFYVQLGGLGVAFISTVVAIIVVFAMLRGDTFHSAFTTFIIVNTDNHLPAWPNDTTRMDLAGNPNSLMHRLLDYGGLASPKIQEGEKEITLF